MKPVQFPECNLILRGTKTKGDPPNVLEIADLAAWTDGKQVVSLWKMSPADRIRALLFGRVWISLLVSHKRFPPLTVQVVKEYFKKERKEKSNV